MRHFLDKRPSARAAHGSSAAFFEHEALLGWYAPGHDPLPPQDLVRHDVVLQRTNHYEMHDMLGAYLSLTLSHHSLVRYSPWYPLKNAKVASPESRHLARALCHCLRIMGSDALLLPRLLAAGESGVPSVNRCTRVRPMCDGVLGITAISIKLRTRRSSVVAISPASTKPLYHL